MSQFLDSHIIESIKAQFDGHAKALQPTCGDEETHWAVPIHPDLVPWSMGEQLDALHGFATDLEAWRAGKVNRGPRIVINAVAGSGKTTVLQAMLVICCRIAPEMHTVASAFNRAISKLLKAILTALKKECGFIGATVIGGSNGVQAAGRRLIFDEAKRHGFDIDFPSGGDRVQRFCRIIIQEMLVNDAATVAESKKEIARLVNARLTGLQDAVDTKYNHSVYYRLAGGQGLKAIVTALMDYAINPSDDEEADLDLISDLLKKVGSDLGLNENHCLHALGTKPAHSLARKVLVRLKTTAWVQGPHRPQFVVDEASLSDKYGWSLGDTLVPDTRRGSSNWGDLQPAWMVADSRENKSAKFNLLNKEWLVVGEGKKSNVKVEMNGAQCRIEKTANGRLNVYLKSAPTASVKRPAWGDIMVKQFIKNNGGRWDGAKWHGISASAEQALRDGFKLPADDADQGDVKVNASGILEYAMADMTWLPLAFDLQAKGDLAEMVFVDEVQDLSVAKASLLHRIADVSTSGFVLVGDLKQAIYGWAGADSRALQSNAEILGCKAYPMTYCWRNSHRVAETAVIRCQQASAEVLSRYPTADLPDYSAHRSPTHIPSWPVGALPARIHGDNIIEAVKWLQANVPNANGENQIIIGCRLNAPLAGFIKSFIKAGMPISTPADEGGIVDECLKWINRDAPKNGFSKPPKTFGYGLGFKGKKHTATSALNSIKQCQEALLITSTAFNGNDGAAALLDSTYTEAIGVLDLLSTIIGLWSSQSDDVRSGVMPPSNQSFDTGFKAFAETLFAGGEGAVMLSSIHRIKGGEGTIFMPVEQALVKGTNEETGEKEMQVKEMFLSKRAIEQSEAAAVQEVNIVYVAYTRAKAATLPIYYTPSLKDQNVEAVLEWAFDEDPDSYTESDGNDDDDNDSDRGCDSCGEDKPTTSFDRYGNLCKTCEDDYFAEDEDGNLTHPESSMAICEAKVDDTCHECDYLFEEGDSVHDCVSCSRPVHTGLVNERKGEYNKCAMPASLEAMLDDTIEEYTCHTCLDKQGEALKEAEATDDAEDSNEAVVEPKIAEIPESEQEIVEMMVENGSWMSRDEILRSMNGAFEPPLARWLKKDLTTAVKRLAKLNILTKRINDHLWPSPKKKCMEYCISGEYLRSLEPQPKKSNEAVVEPAIDEKPLTDSVIQMLLGNRAINKGYDIQEIKELTIYNDADQPLKTKHLTAILKTLVAKKIIDVETVGSGNAKPNHYRINEQYAIAQTSIKNENKAMKITLTEMESRILDHLKHSWYNWGGEPQFSDYFSVELEKDIPEYTMKQMRGALSSLQKKGLISVQEIEDYPFADLKDKSGKAHILYPTAKTYLFYDEHIKFIVEHFADWMTQEDKEYALKHYDDISACANAGGHWFNYTRNGEKVQGDADSAKGGVAGDVISPVFDITGTWGTVTETRPLSGTPCNGIFVANDEAEQERDDCYYAPEYALKGKRFSMRPAVEHMLPLKQQEGFTTHLIQVEAENHCRTCCSKVMRGKLFETPNMKETRLAGEDA